ncbi:MAG: TolB protein [Chloroflexota bacterium]|jgi:Tol biopolymer transport system component|nr:TolB protein [Chloroflexota bacterium]
MTDDRPLERAARSFIEPGPTRAPEAAVGRALDLIATTPQERDWHVPRRTRPMTMITRLLAAAIALALVVVGGAILFRPGGGSTVGNGTPRPTDTSAPSTPRSIAANPSPTAQGSPAAVDYATLKGTILMEHLGNAPDLSEMPTTDYHPDRRRLYLMNPATMTGKTAREFLPGNPASGKLDADVSADGKRVVFMDTADPAVIWLANLDGTGLRKLSTACNCSELDPAFDPTGKRIAFVHVDGAVRNSANGADLGFQWDGRTRVNSWIAIRDLATGKVTKLAATAKVGPDGLPYQPSWSPDGTQLVFNRTTWETGGSPTGTLEIVNISSGSVRTLPTTDPSATVPDATTPGDADWSPDGSTIVFTNFPWSEMGSISDLPPPAAFTIRPDGTGLRSLPGGGASSSWMPDGRILFQGGRVAGGGFFWIMNADGSDPRPVNSGGDSLTDLPQGFAYVPHWIPAP